MFSDQWMKSIEKKTKDPPPSSEIECAHGITIQTNMMSLHETGFIHITFSYHWMNSIDPPPFSDWINESLILDIQFRRKSQGAIISTTYNCIIHKTHDTLTHPQLKYSILIVINDMIIKWSFRINKNQCSGSYHEFFDFTFFALLISNIQQILNVNRFWDDGRNIQIWSQWYDDVSFKIIVFCSISASRIWSITSNYWMYALRMCDHVIENTDDRWL